MGRKRFVQISVSSDSVRSALNMEAACPSEKSCSACIGTWTRCTLRRLQSGQWRYWLLSIRSILQVFSSATQGRTSAAGSVNSPVCHVIPGGAVWRLVEGVVSRFVPSCASGPVKYERLQKSAFGKRAHCYVSSAPYGVQLSLRNQCQAFLPILWWTSTC